MSETITPQLTSLTNAWEPSTHGDRINWTRLRAFLDYLTQHPQQVAQAIQETPEPSGSALLDNLLAGITETLADQHTIPKPAWTALVPPLAEPWLTPGTPTTQAAAKETTPPALAARRVTLARRSLWRGSGE